MFYTPLIEEVIKEEDIILGDFEESYKHLALKHLMGLSYAVNLCSNQRLDWFQKSEIPFQSEVI